MAVDIKGLSRAQLDELTKRIEARKSELGHERISKAKEKILAILKAEKLTIAEIFGTKATGKVKRASPRPKYRNPADHSQTWSGRGKRPRWFNAALSAGKKEKDLLV